MMKSNNWSTIYFYNNLIHCIISIYLSKILIVFIVLFVKKGITQAIYFLISEEISIYEKSENGDILYCNLTINSIL